MISSICEQNISWMKLAEETPLGRRRSNLPFRQKAVKLSGKRTALQTALWKAVFGTEGASGKQPRNLSGNFRTEKWAASFAVHFFMKGGKVMLLRNVTQDIVFEKLDEILKKRPELCNCERCKLDIAALALNALPPRYVVTERGATFSRVNSLDVQISADTVSELTKAIEQVSKEPRHEVHNNSKQ